MCVIAVKPAGVKWLSRKQMKNCFMRNNDGAGLAWVDDEGLHVSKGYFDWKVLWNDMRALEDYSVMLHCRLATHGDINASNCHPFILNNGVVMAHNGIIDIEPDKGKTDSETFGNKYISQFSEEELCDKRIQGLLERSMGSGSKIVVLKKNGDFIILNKKAGIEEQGIWFSNTSFQNYYSKKGYVFYDDYFEEVFNNSNNNFGWASKSDHLDHNQLDHNQLDHYKGCNTLCNGTCDESCMADLYDYDHNSYNHNSYNHSLQWEKSA